MPRIQVRSPQDANSGQEVLPANRLANATGVEVDKVVLIHPTVLLKSLDA
jgi:hypothetical protein